MTKEAVSLEEFTSRIGRAIASAPDMRAVWVTAETSDVRRSGHCYLELVQKHPSTGEPVARIRATIWRSVLARIDVEFQSVTGQRLDSGMKVMVLVSASYHPSYGLSANITGIDPSYTIGDLMKRRLEMIERLRSDGIIDLNRELEWKDVPQRIAVISAAGAAGYGDFLHQLYTSSSHLWFKVRLFPAVMQGAAAPRSVITALEDIASAEDEWDCVVIIRGGGATSDLASFDDYDLAANIAQFPLPVIIGIGHERDVTILDYVANMRVKTPTAAAEWLIGRGDEALGRLDRLASAIHASASSLLSGCKEEIAYASAILPHLPGTAVRKAAKRLDRGLINLNDIISRRIHPEMAGIVRAADQLRSVTATIMERRRSRLEAIDQLLEVLTPEATLRRGYSITRHNGNAVTSSSELEAGATIVTTLASGTVVSTVN